MAKRGLFQSIFGGKSEKNKDFHAYKLLSSWESTFVPYSGNMWDINTVRSAVDAFARRASTAQPRHVRQSAETTVAVNDYIDRILQFRPNPYMTAADFYYKLAAQYKVYNNAIAYPVFDETGRLTAVYPINAQYFELLEYMGTLYCRFTFATGATYICEYSRIIHVRRHFLEHDIFGDGNKPLDTALKTANTLNQSMSKFAELVAVIRGILKVSNAVKTEDLNRRRDDFIRDNLRMENNGAGVIVTDAKYDYTPITDKTTPIPATQLTYVKEEIYDYLGVSKEIVENTATPQQEQAFYSGEIAPFFRRLSQAFSNVLFTEREFGYGNRIGNTGSYPPPGQLLNQKRGTFQGINRDIGVDTALEAERRIRIDSVAACALAYPDRIEIGAFEEDVHRSVGNAGIPSPHDTRDTHRFLRIAYHQVSLRKRPFHPIERHEFRPLRAGLHYHPAPGNPVGIERVERLSQLVQDEVGNVHHIILGIEPYGTQTVLHPVGRRPYPDAAYHHAGIARGPLRTLHGNLRRRQSPVVETLRTGQGELRLPCAFRKAARSRATP